VSPNLTNALYAAARPLLFARDAEASHHLTLQALKYLERLGVAGLFSNLIRPDPVKIMGLEFPNPVGLAAGLDKNGEFIDALAGLGFGFIEVGTVTPRAQSGNPRPRLFRLPKAQALINRFGFNNDGVERFLENVRASRYCGILGLNIGKNADTPLERATDDYLAGLRAVYMHASYVTVNISSPNTKNLRHLQDNSELDGLLRRLASERARLEDQHSRRVPLVVKIAPDLIDEQVKDIADTLIRHGMDGVIATNTTIDRKAVEGLRYGAETGGLSGRPVSEASNRVIRLLRKELGEDLPIIGVGGIMSGADARAKLEAGACLVQLYTGLIYRGPGLVAECAQALRSDQG